MTHGTREIEREIERDGGQRDTTRLTEKKRGRRTKEWELKEEKKLGDEKPQACAYLH